MVNMVLQPFIAWFINGVKRSVENDQGEDLLKKAGVCPTIIKNVRSGKLPEEIIEENNSVSSVSCGK